MCTCTLPVEQHNCDGLFSCHKLVHLIKMRPIPSPSIKTSRTWLSFQLTTLPAEHALLPHGTLHRREAISSEVPCPALSTLPWSWHQSLGHPALSHQTECHLPVTLHCTQNPVLALCWASMPLAPEVSMGSGGPPYCRLLWGLLSPKDREKRLPECWTAL